MVENDTNRLGTPRKKYIGSYVTTEIMNLAGFNYHETSAILQGPHSGRIYIGHIGGLSRREVNTVIVERVIDHRRDGGRRWTEWYLNSFEGKTRMDCNTLETEAFDRQIRETVRRKNRVAGKTLESLLKNLVRKYREPFSTSI